MRILLTADWHIGNYNVSPKRGDDFLTAIDQIISFAAKYKPDLILHGGDVFRVNRPGGAHQRQAAQRVQQLANIAPTAIVPGNHDLTAHGSAIDAWKELASGNLHVCTMPEVVTLPFCHVIAMPWLTSRHLAEFGKSKTSEKQELGMAIEMLLQVLVSRLDDRPKILLTHATALDGKMGAHRPVVLGQDLLWPGSWFEPFDLVCLGHLHKHQVLRSKAFYPGSPERTSFGERDEEKGFYTVNLGDEPVFHKLATRPMIQLEGTQDEVAAELKDVEDEAMLKIKVHLDPDEPFQLAGSRWFSLQVEKIRPVQKREARLDEHATSYSPMQLLEFYFKNIRGKSGEQIAMLLEKTREIAEDVDVVI